MTKIYCLRIDCQFREPSDLCKLTGVRLDQDGQCEDYIPYSRELQRHPVADADKTEPDQADGKSTDNKTQRNGSPDG